MACIVYMTNKKSGHVYAYESVSYRDPVTKAPKSKRKYLGRVDPITKEFLQKPSKKDGTQTPEEQPVSNKEAKPAGVSQDPALKAEVEKLQNDLKRLEDEIAMLTKSQNEVKTLLASIGKSINLFTVN